ncbi:MAG: hypothetical protein FJW20_17680 [Acidimicrobiia bacterium]|nr:hypothetical protein [Acidimicrobiia bacterium]
MNAFVRIPHAKMAESMLHKENVPFQVQRDTIVIQGNEAQRFADLFHLETNRPMTQGFLDPSEAESVPMVKKIIETMVGKRNGSRPRVCFSVPAAPLNATESLTYHEATLRQTFDELDYEVRSINEGLAVIYSELEDTNYTGIGISCGGGLCNVALAYLSMPALSFSIPKAGDFIDSSAASVTGELATRVRIAKEATFHFNGHFTDKLQQVLTVYYEDMIHALIAAMKDAFSNAKRMPKLAKPIPMVLSGGTASPQGFRDRFEKLLRASDFPIEISEIRLARDPMTATANGALVAALTEM